MMTDSKQFYKLLGAITVFWSLVLVLFNARQYGAGPIICAAYLTFYFLSGDLESKFLILLSGLPFQAITKPTATLPSAAVLLYACFIVEYLMRSGWRLRARVILPLAGLFVLQLVAILRYQAGWSGIISTFLILIFATAALDFFFESETPERVFVRCAWVFSLAMLINIYSVSVFPRLPYLILSRKQMLLDRVGRFCALNGDPNYFGQLVLVATGLMAALAIRRFRERNARAGLYAVVAAVLALNGLRSISKGYVFGFAAMVILVLWFVMMENRTSRQKVLLFLLFLVVAFVAARYLTEHVILPTISRRTETDLLTGRMQIWQRYLVMLREDPFIALIGTGFGNAPTALKRFSGSVLAAHNLYIEIFCDIGLVGIALVAVMWADVRGIIRSLVRNSWSLFLWGFLLASMGLSASANDIMYFVIPMCALVLMDEQRNDMSASGDVIPGTV